MDSANPEMLNMLANPQMMSAMMNMMGGGGAPQGSPMNPPPFNPMMAGLMGSPSPAPAQNLRELYASQLQQMKDMGFINDDKNLQALQSTDGDVNAAVEKLLGQLG